MQATRGKKPGREGGINFSRFLLPHSRNSEIIRAYDYARLFLFLILLQAIRADQFRGFFTYILQTTDKREKRTRSVFK